MIPKTLIIGGSGYIGQHIIKAYDAMGVDYYAPDRYDVDYDIDQFCHCLLLVCRRGGVGLTEDILLPQAIF